MIRWIRGLVVAIASHQLMVSAKMKMERDGKYAAADAVAKDLGKPLLVVGGPYGSAKTSFCPLFSIRAHGCGDTCADVDPRACQGCNYTYGDIRDLPFSNRQFGVAFNSHVLEHMPSAEDCALAWGELHRVADYVFTCTPSKQSIFAQLHPDHKLWVQEVGQGILLVEERKTKGTYLVTVRDGYPATLVPVIEGEVVVHEVEGFLEA